jgi:very-short-patch-repair endonuclease
MAHLPPEAYARLRTQHGVISAEQLAIAGISRGALKRLVKSGELRGGLRGVYRSPVAPVDELSRCAEVCLAHPDIAIGGPTGGRVHSFRRVSSDRRIHVLAPPASNPAVARWVVPYRTAAIEWNLEVVQRDDGIRVTTPARTAFDLTRHLPPNDVLSVIEQAIAEHGVRAQDLYAMADRWTSRGRPWITTFVRQLDRRLPGGAADSHPEIRVGNALRSRGVRGLVRQHRLILPGHRRASFDLAVPELRWAIEVDRHPTHVESAGVASDERRDTASEAIGWTVSRITRADYEHRFAARIDELAAHYHHLRQLAMSQRSA